MGDMSKPKGSPESPPSAFDAIAPAWYNFRHYTIFKAELEALASRWQKGNLLNLGCGHGADFLPFKEGFEMVGVDYSAGMLKLAAKFSKKHGFSARLVQSDMRSLPFASDSFDFAVSVASLHHLKGHEEQVKALSELKRVLKPGAEVFVTVWNRCQPRFWVKPKEVLVPFKAGGEIVERYYYLFTFGEVERLARQAGFEVLKSFPESRYRFPVRSFSRNICLLLKKTN
jgi:ubiquinone/menaquinone biosynthesis C-methylase UbiE